MKIEELINILSKGEGTTIEYKEAQKGVPTSLYETIVSFSNTDGGVIVLGVDDDGKVLSIDKSNQSKYLQEIATNINNSECVSPPLYLQPEVVSFPEGDVIVLRIPVSSQIHKQGSKIYWRADDNDQDVTNNQQKISDIYNRKRDYFSESKIYPFLSFDDLDPKLFSKARGIIASINSTHPLLLMDEKQMLTATSLYRKDFKTGEEGLTLAAVLVFGKDETIGHLIPGYKVDALVRKINLDRYDDRLVLRTNLIDTYLQLLTFVKKHLDERFYVEDGQRKDLRELIFREVVGNLIVHREYTNVLSSDLIIQKDSVRVTNPNKALFHGPLDPNLFNPYPKNPNIRKFFTAFGWTDELGSGVRNVTKYLTIYTPGAIPVFIENDTFITEIPLVSVLLQHYLHDLANWFEFSDEIKTYLSKAISNLTLATSLNKADWNQTILHLVTSWCQKGSKLHELNWPKNQVFTDEDIKKVTSWNQNGNKLLHKKINYLIRTLFFTLEPTSLDQIMTWMEYANKKTFRDNYLIPLQQVGFINMTKPDSPKSPNQKYVITEKGKLFLMGK